MSRPVPLNDLDRAIKALRRSPAATPDLYRRLCEGSLWGLVPYHPEVEGADIPVQNGSQFPLALLSDADGEFVPIFSSEARVEEALTRAGIPRRTYSAAGIDALDMLTILGAMGLRAMLNKSCATGEVMLFPNLLRDLANGKALQPLPIAEREPAEEETTIKLVSPANYPTAVVQAAFDCLRAQPHYKAAWIFYHLATPDAPPAPPWTLFVLMEPRDETVFHDLNLVMQSVSAKNGGVNLQLVDENSFEERKVMFEAGEPFYRFHIEAWRGKEEK